MRIFLTGGTGFLGRRLAGRLVRAGHEVRALVRPAASRRPMDPGVTVVEGDVTDAQVMRRAAEGCDALVHAAALVKMWVPDRGLFDRVNVGGLANALEAARLAGVGRVLYTSSFIALGPTDGRVADETWVHAPSGHHNDYERTKAAADRLARERAAAGFPLVTVYPGVVYGPGELTDGSLMTRTVHDFMRRRVPGYLGSGRQVVCLAYMDDVVDGHLLALEKGRPGRGYVLGGTNTTYLELFGLLEEITGVPAPTRHVPFRLMEVAGAALRLRARLTGIEPWITDEVVRIYKHDWAYSSQRAESELGYRITPLKEGLRRTVEWLRDGAART